MSEPMSLKESGVPFTERMAFRCKHAPFVFMSCALVITTPLLFIWGLVHESGEVFIGRCNELLSDRVRQMEHEREILRNRFSNRQETT